MVKQKKSREDENSPIVGRRGKKVKKMNGKKFGEKEKNLYHRIECSRTIPGGLDRRIFVFAFTPNSKLRTPNYFLH